MYSTPKITKMKIWMSELPPGVYDLNSEMTPEQKTQLECGHTTIDIAVRRIQTIIDCRDDNTYTLIQAGKSKWKWLLVKEPDKFFASMKETSTSPKIEEVA
jgi:hypothetical protein